MKYKKIKIKIFKDNSSSGIRGGRSVIFFKDKKKHKIKTLCRKKIKIGELE